MHDLAVIFEDERVGDLLAPDLSHAAHVVAAKVEQHEMLGPLLGIGEQLLASTLSSLGVAPRGRVPAIGRIVTLPSRTLHQISGD